MRLIKSMPYLCYSEGSQKASFAQGTVLKLSGMP